MCVWTEGVCVCGPRVYVCVDRGCMCVCVCVEGNSINITSPGQQVYETH